MDFAPYSQSRLEAFKCPARFWKIYGPAHERVEVVSLYARAGGHLHDFCRDYFSHLRVAGRATDLDWVRERLEDLQALLSDDVAEEVVPLAEAFADSHTAPPATSQVEAELAFNKDKKATKWNSPDCWLRGRLDLIEQNGSALNITDYKSGRYVPTQKAVERSFQLKFYAYLAHLSFPDIDEINITLDFVRYQTTRSAQIFRAEIPMIEKSIERRIRRIETAEEFLEIVGSQCERCAFPMDCETFKKAGKGSLPLLLDADMARRTAEELKLIDLKRKALCATLKGWVEKEGPIKISDEVLDFHPQDKISFPDKGAVASFLLEHGLDKAEVWKVFNLNPSSLKAGLGKKYRELSKELASLGQKDVSAVFKFKRSEIAGPLPDEPASPLPVASNGLKVAGVAMWKLWCVRRRTAGGEEKDDAAALQKYLQNTYNIQSSKELAIEQISEVSQAIQEGKIDLLTGEVDDIPF